MESNVDRIEKIARVLDELSEQVVFVGGSVVEFYADDPAASDIRPTLDVDCVIPIRNRSTYWELEKKLREKKFQNDMSAGAPICRWIFDGIVVDIMPDDPEILGFSSRWYKTGIEHRRKHQISPEMTIQIFPVEYYLATKVEALHSRGGADLRGSSDLEDIVYILNNNTEVVGAIKGSSDSALKDYLQQAFRQLLNEPNIMEIIECMLSFEDGERKFYVHDKLLELTILSDKFMR